MAYKFDKIPSKVAHQEETADFWEIQALKEFGIPVSSLSILKLVSKEFDELDNDGLESEEDEFAEELHQVFEHLRNRIKYSDENYPFNLTKSGIRIDSISGIRDYLYVFMLLCTRFNMTKMKIHDGIDATLLFEKICAEAAKNYFGTNSKSIVFGTANPGKFKKKVNHLISSIGEGVTFTNPDENTPTKNDDGIDIVVWKEFSDKKKGKLIGFGQCKTGTSWRNEIERLNPDAFCTKWFHTSPIYNPLRMVFLTDTMNENFNYYGTQQGYLVFNRFRTIEYAIKSLSQNIMDDMKKWVDAAMDEVK